MQREFPVVIRKSGIKFVPTFPVELEPGDQLVITKEMRGSKVPEGRKWTVSGYTDLGLTMSVEDMS